MSAALIPLVVLVGPTGTGKTACGVRLAAQLKGEIVSADSMQVYRGMDIGSAKPGREECSSVPHHLIDIVDPQEFWTVVDYQRAARRAIEDIHVRGRLPIVVGGTGLYIDALLFDMDFSLAPEADGRRSELEEEARRSGAEAMHRRLQKLDAAAAARIHPHNLKRVVRAIEVCERSGGNFPVFSDRLQPYPTYQPLLLGLTFEREELYRRIEQRVDIMIAAGLAGEVCRLYDAGLTENCPAMQGIGYKEYVGFFRGEYMEEEAVRLIKQRTRNYAKRQLTWFRRYEGLRWYNRSLIADNQLRETILSDIAARWPARDRTQPRPSTARLR